MAKRRRKAGDVFTVAAYDYDELRPGKLDELKPLGSVHLSGDHRLFELASALEPVLIELGRDPSDAGVHDHMWFFQLGKLSDRHGKAPVWKRTKHVGSQLGGWDPSDKSETAEQSTALSGLGLQPGALLNFEYDMGTTTRVLCRVTAVTPAAALAGLGRELPFYQPRSKTLEETFKVVAPDQRQAMLSQCPAYTAAPDCRLDTLFPQFASTFLNGQHLRSSLGLSSMRTRRDDATFGFIEGQNHDEMLVPQTFDGMTVLLATAEQACQPNGQAVRFRVVSPPKLEPDEEERLNRAIEASKAQKGPPGSASESFHRLSIEEAAACTELGFDFGALFPQTQEQLLSGRFRWFTYAKQTLTVCVGRGVGGNRYVGPQYMGREPNREHILCEWPGGFDSLHEMMCAVELSWVYRNKPLGQTMLALDSDLGPENPEPKMLAMAKDASELCARAKEPENQPSEQDVGEDFGFEAGACSAGTGVTALTVDPSGVALYSGHENGMITKWDLATGSRSWVQPQTLDGPVLGLLVHEFLYCWGRQPTIIAMLLDSGNPHRNLLCDVGYAEPASAYDSEGEEELDEELTFEQAKPAVNCMVSVGGLLVVGLHCRGFPAYNEAGDEEEQEEEAHGNIVCFQNPEVQQSWRGHTSPVVSLATTKGHLVVSASAGLRVEDLILWDTKQPGQILRRLVISDLRKENEARQRLWTGAGGEDSSDDSNSDDEYDGPINMMMKRSGFSMHRVRDLEGMLFEKDKLLLVCNHGDLLAIVNVESFSISEYLKIGLTLGYECEEACHAAVATDDQCALVVNGMTNGALLFQLEGLGAAQPDTEQTTDGNREEEDAMARDRALAVGIVELPHSHAFREDPWTGFSSSQGPPPRKKRQWFETLPAGAHVIAIHGLKVFAGYADGSIRKQIVVSSEIVHSGVSTSSSSHMRLPPGWLEDQMPCPVLISSRQMAEAQEEEAGPCATQ